MHTQNKHIGLLIQQYRKQQGVSQKWLAEKLKLKTPQYISNVERGRSSMSLKQLKKTCKYLKIDEKQAVQHLLYDYFEKLRKAGILREQD